MCLILSQVILSADPLFQCSDLSHCVFHLARQALNERKFGGNQVLAVSYPENKFAQGDLDG